MFKTELFNKLATMFGLYRLKGVKTHNTDDGGAVYGSIYRGKQKVGSFNDDGFGGELQISFINKEEKAVFEAHCDKNLPQAARMSRDGTCWQIRQP